jgi:CheY-like chemotaxis protein
MRMLIYNVDDDSDDREFFCDAIKAVHPELPCVMFENGVELLNFMERNQPQPDYIFIDINMPKMNGHECAQEIKLNYLRGETQIVMYSTSFNPEDVKRFNKDGFKYIQKQNSMTDLIKTIKTVIARPAYHPAETP